MKYVISVKRIKDCLGKPINTENQHYEYASLDMYAGGYSTYSPVFDNYRPHAIEFKNIKKALEWWEANKEHIGCLEYYDLSTLAVRKEIVLYKALQFLNTMNV